MHLRALSRTDEVSAAQPACWLADADSCYATAADDVVPPPPPHGGGCGAPPLGGSRLSTKCLNASSPSYGGAVPPMLAGRSALSTTACSSSSEKAKTICVAVEAKYSMGQRRASSDARSCARSETDMCLLLREAAAAPPKGAVMESKLASASGASLWRMHCVAALAHGPVRTDTAGAGPHAHL